jgi:UDP-hydrolysing UDP-N-acetyl-D-glucosamine 2-epimerase
MRHVHVVTSSRADYGIYRSILREIHGSPDLSLGILVTGMHLSPQYGYTVGRIEADEYPIIARIETLLNGDTPESIAKTMALGVAGFAQQFSQNRPDILLVLGDRFEMYTAALAALPFRILVAHVHGGEVTEGAIDDALRHSMTKLSHIHFASTQTYANRIIQLGEQPERVIVSGAPALDNIATLNLLDLSDVKERFKLDFASSPLLVTYHPVTLEYENTEAQINTLLSALQSLDIPIVFSLPNADTGNQIIRQKIDDFIASHDNAWGVESFGQQAYFSMMFYALAMVGNSSSGIIEAASFNLPVVNIGIRQAGRIRSANVIDCDNTSRSIQDAIQQAIDPTFKASIQNSKNLYQQTSPASHIIVETLKTVPLDGTLIRKQFFDMEINS